MSRPFPNYGTPGAPNLDPYYMSDAEIAAFEAQEAAAAAAKAEDDRIEALDAEEDAAAWRAAQ